MLVSADVGGRRSSCEPISRGVTGEAIIGANVFRDMFAAVRDIVGGQSATYERGLAEAREVAPRRDPQQKAEGLGANAVIGVDIELRSARTEQRHADGGGQRHGCRLLTGGVAGAARRCGRSRLAQRDDGIHGGGASPAAIRRSRRQSPVQRQHPRGSRIGRATPSGWCLTRAQSTRQRQTAEDAAAHEDGPCASTSRRTSARRAPSATRTPESRAFVVRPRDAPSWRPVQAVASTSATPASATPMAPAIRSSGSSR